MMDDLHGDFINFYKRSKNDVVSTSTLVTIYIDEIYLKVYVDLVDNMSHVRNARNLIN